MKTKYLITIALVVLVSTQSIFSQTYLDSQKENNEYKRLQQATNRAYAVPTSSTNQSSSNSGSTTSNASSSSNSNSGSSVTDYNFNNTERLNLNSYESRQAKNEKLHNKVQAIYDAFDAKEKKWHELMDSSGLEKSGENFEKFVQMGVQSGLDDYTSRRMLGGSPDAYDSLQGNSVGALAGSTKDECQGDCSETLKFEDGSTYVGNSLHGYPEGKGKIITTTGVIFEGDFHRGNLEGWGKLTKPDGTIRYDMYKKGANSDGPFKIVKPTYEQTGNYVNGKVSGVYKTTFNNGDIAEKDTNNPNFIKYFYSSGGTFEGIRNDKGENVKGKITEASGTSFVGEFKNNKQYRGIVNSGNIQISGEFYDNGNILKVGRKDNLENKTTEYLSMDINSKRSGYCLLREANGTIYETLYKDDKKIGSIQIFYQDGGSFAGQVSKVANYNYFGIFFFKNNTSVPYGLNATTNNWEKLEAKDFTRANDFAKQAQTEIAKAKAVYVAATNWSTDFKVD
ncbi:hypothetical protein [Flavobacterium sp.]|uniref:hypothetical protein n=1 Tax=Flavobacterium sp. TaxID=239 RepID=UPI00286DBF3E|nr:hypothetical protein [Flavobacterium sp.]